MLQLQSYKKFQNRLERLKSVVKRFYIYAVLLLIVVVFSVIKLGEVEFFGRGHFLSPDNLINMLRMSVPIITIAGGFTLIMISGNIDLSVGSAMSLSAVVFAYLILNGFALPLAILLTIVLGVAMGFLNGFIVMKLRITPVIATLVTLNLFKGLGLLIVPDGLSGIKGNADQVMPAWINDYARKDIFLGLPMSFFVAIAIIVILVIIQRKTIIGKYSAAIGGNRTAAELSGINTVKMVWLLYVILGILAAIAGIARASYMSIGDPLTGDGMETDCIIAVLLGGTAFTGGEGSVVKTIIGAFIIICITTGLLTIIPAFWQMFAKGAVLILAVVMNHLLVQEKVKA